MPMPKASSDVDYSFAPGKHDIWVSGQIAPLEPESIAQAVQKPPNLDFGHGVPRPHRRQIKTS
jgi:hypothetical protein